MTTFAMTADMLPIALRFGGDSSFRHPMAVATDGGPLSSTALSLLVVPVAFTYVDGFEQWLRGMWRRERRGTAVGVSFKSNQQ
jgi:Cu/Ag efflux pump CusA